MPAFARPDAVRFGAGTGAPSGPAVVGVFCFRRRFLLDGGPGASSMFGLLVELGPLILNEYSVATPEFKKSGVPTLYRNDFGRSKLGGVLMFDWPPPVGFSYCHGKASGGGTSCGDWDDARTATVQYAALKGWFDLFPERRPNPLYLTGESYAGICAPPPSPTRP